MIIIGTLAIAAAVAACGGSENCDEAVERCRTDCPDGSVLQTECIAAFEVSTETACEAALMDFVCTSTVP
ncbi:MAG: hypothetical protein AAFN74_19935 [Myxococcota bacterium]